MSTPRVRQACEALAGLADSTLSVHNFERALAELIAAVREPLAALLREMDRTQQETDEAGGREVAWYSCRDRFEDVLGLERGELDAVLEDGPAAQPSGTVYGIRPHRPVTPQEDAHQRLLMDAWDRTNPITAEDARRMLGTGQGGIDG